MAYLSLNDFILKLDREGELARITAPVSPYLEISEITDRIVKNRSKALFFENTGTPFPLLINMFGSEKRMSMALGVENLDDIGREIDLILKGIAGHKDTFFDKLKVLPQLGKIASWMPSSSNRKGACQEVVMQDPNLTLLPVLTCWPADGGPFITLPMVHTVDPESGSRNLGMYRMQVMGKAETGMHWHLHKGSAAHFRKYKEIGKRMPVTVTLGGDPVYTYCATAPLPENLDEYLLAGFLRKKKVEMVKCLTNDIEVPADVDFVIEGYVDPDEDLVLEGPFGDHTGFYSLADYYPLFHVTCITHRKNAVYPATIVGIPPMEDGWMGKATERIFLSPIKMTAVPELIDMVMPEEGVFHNIVVARIKKTFPGQAVKVMNALWGAGQMMFNKIIIITGENVDIQKYDQVLDAVLTSTVFPDDIHFSTGPLDVLDHSARQFAYGSKLGIDATGEPMKIDPPAVMKAQIISSFSEIADINDIFIQKGKAILILTIHKSRAGHIREVAELLIRNGFVKNVRFIIFTDAPMDVKALNLVAWITAGNIDPQRDCHIIDNSVFVADATRKSPAIDGFKREWPNILVMDDKTIQKVDNRWNEYKLGYFIASPSLPLKPLIQNNKAVF